MIPDQAVLITGEEGPDMAYYSAELQHPSGSAGLLREIGRHHYIPGNATDRERARQAAWADIHALREWLREWGGLMSAKANRLKNRVRFLRAMEARLHKMATELWARLRAMEEDRNHQRARKEEAQARLSRLFHIELSEDRKTWELTFRICRPTLDHAKTERIKQDLIEHAIYTSVDKLLPNENRDLTPAGRHFGSEIFVVGPTAAALAQRWFFVPGIPASWEKVQPEDIIGYFKDGAQAGRFTRAKP